VNRRRRGGEVHKRVEGRGGTNEGCMCVCVCAYVVWDKTVSEVWCCIIDSKEVKDEAGVGEGGRGGGRGGQIKGGGRGGGVGGRGKGRGTMVMT